MLLLFKSPRNFNQKGKKNNKSRKSNNVMEQWTAHYCSVLCLPKTIWLTWLAFQWWVFQFEERHPVVQAAKHCDISSFQRRLREEAQANVTHPSSYQPSAAIPPVRPLRSWSPQVSFPFSRERVNLKTSKSSQTALPLSARGASWTKLAARLLKASIIHQHADTLRYKIWGIIQALGDAYAYANCLI